MSKQYIRLFFLLSICISSCSIFLIKDLQYGSAVGDSVPEVQKNSNPTNNLNNKNQLDEVSKFTVESSDTRRNANSDLNISFDKVLDWSKDEFGRYSWEMNSFEHQYYATETLEDLVEQGDFIAMHVLARRYMDIQDEENAQRINDLAAAYGSTVALANIAEKFTSGNREDQIERLAYYQAAILRGDEDFFYDANALLLHTKIDLTKEEKNLVKVKGQQIYRKILNKRFELGMGDFNPIPRDIKSMINEHYSLMRNKFVSGKNALFIVN